jgi:AraC-like DNA-binding protein
MLELALPCRDADIRTQVVRVALARVRECGGDVRALRERFGLPEEAETAPDAVLPLRTLHAFLEAAERAARDPFLGLHMAAAYPRGLYGIVEFIGRNCATLREALQRSVKYSALMTNRVQVTFLERDGVGTIEHRIPGEPLATGRHSNEFFLSALVLLAREVTGVHVAPARVWFAHPAPGDIRELVALLGTRELRFGGGTNRLEVAEHVLALPIRGADPALLTVLDREATRSLERGFLDEVRAAVEQQLAAGPPTVDALADTLATSPRTLQRRLAEAGTSYRDVVETVRADLARSYVGSGELGVGDVAFRLGYGELSAFLRAFKRWTGMTPAEFRQRE